jgi:hypothetical protein
MPKQGQYYHVLALYSKYYRILEAYIVGAGVVGVWGGDPCGRPSGSPYTIAMGTLVVARLAMLNEKEMSYEHYT